VTFPPQPPTWTTYPANQLIWVQLTETSEVRHPIASLELLGGRTAIHPVSYPVLMSGVVRAVHSLMDQWFVTDLPTGRLLPVLSLDPYAARAVAGSWQHHVSRGLLDPNNPERVVAWAQAFVARAPANVRVRMIEEMQWPPYLPPSPYTST
jgi:hypothetical protein